MQVDIYIYEIYWHWLSKVKWSNYSFIQMCTARFIHGILIRVEYLMGMIMTCEPSKKVAPNFIKTFRVKFQLDVGVLLKMFFICLYVAQLFAWVPLLIYDRRPKKDKFALILTIRWYPSKVLWNNIKDSKIYLTFPIALSFSNFSCSSLMVISWVSSVLATLFM